MKNTSRYDRAQINLNPTSQQQPATASCSLREPEFFETPERQWLVIPPHRRPNLSLSPSLPLSLRPHLPSLLHSLCAWKDVCGWSRVAASPGADPTIPSEAVGLCPPPALEVSCTAHGGETRRPFPLCAVDRQKTACQVTWRTTKRSWHLTELLSQCAMCPRFWSRLLPLPGDAIQDFIGRCRHPFSGFHVVVTTDDVIIFFQLDLRSAAAASHLSKWEDSLCQCASPASQTWIVASFRGKTHLHLLKPFVTAD